MLSLTNKIRLVTLLAGFISMELEILGTRILTPVFGSTIYVWTSLIGITLIFLAIGYWYGGKLADKGKITINTFGPIILLLGIYISLLPHFSRLILSYSGGLDIIWGPLVTSLMILSLPIFFLGFVVPTSVKLITQSLEKIGTRAGEIYSLATIGSIIGTFVTGFFLISYLGVVKTCLATGIILIFLSLTIIESKIKFLSILAVPALIMPLSYPSEILESFDSYSGQIKVIEQGIYTYLYTGNIIQTLANSQTKENESYHALFYNIPFVYNSDHKKVLMIGLGGGSIAKELSQRYDIDLDIVEVEPKMLDLAKKYFGWQNEGNVYFDDGRHFLRNTLKKYDIIIMDLGMIYCSWHMYTQEAFQEMYSHLNADGVVLINIIGAIEGKYSEATRSEYRTLKQVFPEVLVLRKPNIESTGVQNIVLLGSKKEINKDKLLELAKESGLYFIGGVVSLEEVVKETDKIYLNENIELTTDNHPVAEFYDYVVWSELGKIGKDYLKYFLP